MKKLILLDLDNTLFNPEKFRSTMFKEIAKEIAPLDTQGEAIALCESIYLTMMKEIGVFDADIFIERLVGKTYQKKEAIKNSIFNKDLLKENMHEDVGEALEAFSKMGDIAILSQGETLLQTAKLVPIKTYFTQSNVHITRNKVEEMKDILETYSDYQIYFIDDMLKMLFAAKKINMNVTTIWIKRGRHAMQSEPIAGFLPDSSVGNLHEAVAFIQGR